MLGKVLQFGGGEVAMQGVEIGEKGMREEEGKTMGRCSTSGGVIITKCEFHVVRKTKTFTSSSQRICQLVHLVTLRAYYVWMERLNGATKVVLNHRTATMMDFQA